MNPVTKRFVIGLAVLTFVLWVPIWCDGARGANFPSASTLTPSATVVSASVTPTARKWKTVNVRGTKVEIPLGKEYRCPKYHRVLKKAGLTPVNVWSYLMWRESRCQPQVIGWNYKKGKSPSDCKLAPADIYKKCKAVSSYDSGLLQINSSWVTVTSQVCGTKWGDLRPLRTSSCNLKVAKYLFENGGLGNWGF